MNTAKKMKSSQINTIQLCGVAWLLKDGYCQPLCNFLWIKLKAAYLNL